MYELIHAQKTPVRIFFIILIVNTIAVIETDHLSFLFILEHSELFAMDEAVSFL